MDLVASDKSFTIMVAVAAFVVFWAVWVATTWQPPMEARLKALRTRRMSRSISWIFRPSPSSNARTSPSRTSSTASPPTSPAQTASGPP